MHGLQPMDVAPLTVTHSGYPMRNYADVEFISLVRREIFRAAVLL
jgi:hypothetical protein